MCSVLSSVFTLLCFYSSISVVLQHEKSSVKMELIQNNTSVLASSDTFFLKKEPFVIRIEMMHSSGVYLNFSYSDEYHHLDKNKCVELLEGKIGAEYDDSNAHKDIFIDTVAFHYWSCYYDENNSYSFNKFNRTKWKKKMFTGERDVNYFFDGKQDLPVFEIKGDLYVFLLVMKHEKSKPIEELIRRKYVIKWI